MSRNSAGSPMVGGCGFFFCNGVGPTPACPSTPCPLPLVRSYTLCFCLPSVVTAGLEWDNVTSVGWCPQTNTHSCRSSFLPQTLLSWQIKCYQDGVLSSSAAECQGPDGERWWKSRDCTAVFWGDTCSLVPSSSLRENKPTWAPDTSESPADYSLGMIEIIRH